VGRPNVATTVEIEALVVVRETASGSVYAYPLANPDLVCRATSVEQALTQQEEFLTEFLEKAPAWVLPELAYPAASELVELAAVLPRADLPRRIRVTTPLTIPCVVTPDRDARWVHVLPLRAIVHVRPEDDLEDRVRTEVEKLALARTLDAREYLALMPAVRHAIARLRLVIERQDLGDLGERSTERRRKTKEKERETARKLLEKIGTDLVAAAKKRKPPPVIGRDREIRSLAALLAGRERLSVVLVGDEMAGKSAIVHGLVALALDANAGGPNPLRERAIFATSGAQLVAGQSGFGQLAERIDQVMRAAEQLDAILYFDNLGDLLSGRTGSIEDMISMIRPFLADDRVRVVGELSPEQLEHYEKQHVGFFSSLARITVEPLSRELTTALLQARITHAAKTEPHRPNLVPAAVQPLVQLSERYLAYQAFPGKAVRLAEELRAVHEADVADDGSPRPIGPHEVYRAFSIRSGIPLFLLRDDQAVKYAEVEAFFRRRVIGQAEAIRRVAQTLCVVKAGLQPPAKPLANFLFIGPTGVGKTEVAKTLARFLFGGADRLVRFDMSEYMDPLAAERLIRGTHSDEGELTRKVRQQPFCVVLLDEIEKAHRAVFDLLLQVCGEGRLTDARGRTTWFHNAIIIMTSNLGAAHRRRGTGFDDRDVDAHEAEDRWYVEQVDKHFRPEFVNRIDRVIPFRSLSREEIAQVAHVSLQRIRERDGLLGRRVELELTEAAVAELAASGYSDRYGARALRRHLEDALVAPLSAASSALGADLGGAHVHVRLRSEPPVPAEGTLALESEAGALALRVDRPPAQHGRRTVGDLQFVAGLRRDADACMATGAIEELQEKIDYMVADLASAANKRDAAVSLAATAAAHARLDGLLAEAKRAQHDLAVAEELAMVAQQEGESAALFRDEAADAFGRFETAFTRAILGSNAGDTIAFLARAVEHPTTLRRWLVPFLRAAEERGWDVILHRFEDKQRSDGSWPPEIPWGQPRTPSWALERLRDDSDDEIARHWRAVLVRAKGPFVGGLLRLEMGLVRWEPQPDDPTTRHVELYRMTDAFDLNTNLLGAKAFAPPDRSKHDDVVKMGAERQWTSDGVLKLLRAHSGFAVEDPIDYWCHLERFLFGLVAHSALAGSELLED
jgi:ATP-dependent Clp protease ATP-binding subunit ClpC